MSLTDGACTAWRCDGDDFARALRPHGISSHIPLRRTTSFGSQVHRLGSAPLGRSLRTGMGSRTTRSTEEGAAVSASCWRLDPRSKPLMLGGARRGRTRPTRFGPRFPARGGTGVSFIHDQAQQGLDPIALGVVALLPFASRVVGEVFGGRSVGIAQSTSSGPVLLLIGLKLRADAAEPVPPPPRPDVRPSDTSER